MRLTTKLLFIILFLSIFSQPHASNRITPVVTAIEKTEGSVVNIRTEKIVAQRYNPFFNDPFFNDFFGFNRTYKTRSLGSGFFVKKGGVVVTNYHVTEAASEILIILPNGKQYKADVIGKDKLLDIAILKIKSQEEFPVAKLGDSDNLYLGETIIAMGNPFGLNSSVTTGVISSTNRILKINNGLGFFIQTDALINPGNSGGPLINLDGEVIGINTAIYKNAQGIGFSIPINILKRTLNEFLNYGKIRKSYAGFYTEESKEGLKISGVEKGSPASKSGLKKNDIITKINGIPVVSQDAMKYLIRTYPPNSEIDIGIIRENENIQKMLKLTTFPDNYGLTFIKEKYGLAFTDVTSLITVTQSSIPSYIKKGDVLIAVNGKEINDIKELDKQLIDNIGENITFTLYRGSTTFQITLRL